MGGARGAILARRRVEEHRRDLFGNRAHVRAALRNPAERVPEQHQRRR